MNDDYAIRFYLNTAGDVMFIHVKHVHIGINRSNKHQMVVIDTTVTDVFDPTYPFFVELKETTLLHAFTGWYARHG